MVKRDMKKALGASLKAEEQAVKSRFEKTKTVPEKRAPVSRESPKPEATGQFISDSFNLPEGDDELISRIKRRCMKVGLSTDKSEVLRAGLAALDAMQDRELARLFASLPRVRTGGRRRKNLIFIVRRADAVKLRRPLQIRRFQPARKVLIGQRIATITAGNLTF